MAGRRSAAARVESNRDDGQSGRSIRRLSSGLRGPAGADASPLPTSANSAWATRVAALALVLVFWCVSVWQLERFPPLHGDEPWILAPGYKLAHAGVFGSDLFAGYAGLDQHYLQFLPLFSILQGGLVRALGLGVFQMRYLPVAGGVVALALTFRVGRGLGGDGVGLTAALLLVGWRWAPGTHRFFGSGVPLLDIARVARFDILVAPLGLAALWATWRAGRQDDWRRDAVAGLLAGLASLTHVTGVIWVGIVLLWVWANPASLAARWRRTATMLGVVGILWLPWLALIAGKWSDFIAQHRGLSRPWLEGPGGNFVVSSLVEEPRRYLLQLRQPLTYARPGVWLLLVGLPLAGLRLAREAVRGLGDASAAGRPGGRRWGGPGLRPYAVAPAWTIGAWLASAGLAPMALAVAVAPKNFGYLAAVVPMYCLTLAWALRRGRAWRAGWAKLALAVVLVEGIGGIAHMHVRATALGSPAAFFQALRAALPPGRIVGPSTAWLGLMDRDYAFNMLAYLWANPPDGEAALTYTAAFDRLEPDLMLVDAGTGEPTGLSAEETAWPEEIAAYAREHSTRLVATVMDPEGRRIEIYEIESR